MYAPQDGSKRSLLVRGVFQRRRWRRRDPPENPEIQFHFSSLADLSLSLFQHDLLKPAGQRKSGRNCFTHPLVDPRYTTSAVVKRRWCAEAVPPRTKRDSQYIAQQRHQKKPTSGEHEWLLSVQAQFRF